MKNISIFVDAAECELNTDHEAIAGLIDRLNRCSTDIGMHFSILGGPGDTDPSSRAEQLKMTDLIFVILYQHLSEDTYRNFSDALDTFRLTGRPKIFTFFRHNDRCDRSVKDFMEKISHELNHYYNVYEDTDTLLYRVLLQLVIDEDYLDLKLDHGNISLNGHDILPVENSSAFVNNDYLQRLRSEVISADRNMADPALLRRKISEYEQLQERIFEASCHLAKKSFNEMPEYRRNACRLIDDGRYEEACEVLKFEDILKEHKSHASDRLPDELLSGWLATIADDISVLQERIDMLTLSEKPAQNTYHTEDIRNSFLKIAELEACACLVPNGTFQYASFCFDRALYRECEAASLKALKLQIFDYSEAPEVVFCRAGFNYLLGRANGVSELYREAMRFYTQAEVLLSGLHDNTPRYRERLASVNHELGMLCMIVKNYSDAGYRLKTAAEIRKALAWQNPAKYGWAYYDSCFFLSRLCSSTDKPAQAERYMSLAREISATLKPRA